MGDLLKMPNPAQRTGQGVKSAQNSVNDPSRADFNDKTVVITGAAGGLGKALVNVFGMGDYKMVLQYNKTELDINVLTNNECVQGDLRMFGVIDKLAELAERRKATILINNAAEYRNDLLKNLTECDIRRIIDANLVFPIILTRRLWPIFVKHGGGLVININSLAGKECGIGGESVYCASKFGLSGFSKAIQFEATADNVRVINMFLGAMNTPMIRHRRDPEKCLDPTEVALMIESVCIAPESFKLDEITLTRRNY